MNVLATIAAATGATAVYTHKEVCSEEQTIVSNVECAMNRLPRKCTLKTYWGGHTLYHVDDLPFNAQKDLPDVYSSFRRKVEERCKVRSPLPAPGTLRPQPIGFDDKLGDPAAMPLANGVIARGANDGAGKLPSLEALGAADLRPVYAALGIRDPFGSAAVASGAGTASGPSSSSPVAAASNDNDDFWSEYAPPPSASASAAASSAAASGTIDDEAVWSLPSCIDKRSVLQFRGGETAAVQRLKEYIWDSDSLRSYKETRNGLLGPNYSSKFSVWLAFGCVSPRSIFAEVAEYEKKVVANESTYWLGECNAAPVTSAQPACVARASLTIWSPMWCDARCRGTARVQPSPSVACVVTGWRIPPSTLHQRTRPLSSEATVQCSSCCGATSCASTA